MKPPLTYYGGKQTLSNLIVSIIPEHNLYCEPFFGGGAVLFAKPPSNLEVINDTNGELINFYKVVQTNFKSLEKEIKCSRELHQRAKIILEHPELFDEIKRAWAVWTMANQSYGAKLNGNWGYDKKENKSGKSLCSKRAAFSQENSERLRKVEIECSDALTVIKTRDSKESFFYCDPPYINTNQGHYKGYTKKEFTELLEVLSKIKGKFLLSSYPSEIFSEYTKKYNWFSKEVNSTLAMATNPRAKVKRKVEVLTGNYEIQECSL